MIGWVTLVLILWGVFFCWVVIGGLSGGLFVFCVGLWVGRFVGLSGWVTVYCVCCCVSLLVLDCGGSASEIVLEGLVVLLLY